MLPNLCKTCIGYHLQSSHAPGMLGCCDMDLASVAAAPPVVHEERVGDASTLVEGGRMHANVNGRYVTILKLGGQLFCIDSVCFHAGGPLGVGDIEDVNGRACLVCPWHYYKIDIATGDKYYQQIAFVDGKMKEGDWVSNGIRQRTHTAREHDDGIWVTLSTQPLKRDSDQYACQAACGDRVMNTKGGHQGLNVGGDGKQPSGAVLRAAREAAKAALPE